MSNNQNPKDGRHSYIYLMLMALTIFKLMGLGDVAATSGTALCYYLLWRVTRPRWRSD